MSEAQQLKEQCLSMAVAELEQLMNIIGDLGYIGYKISLCRLKGSSYLQCAQKFNISKSLAQYYWNNCISKGYDQTLQKMFNIPKSV